MTFLNPLVLFGLIAASIPVLLHLLNLRKLRTVEFSSLMFIKEIERSQIRRLKIKQLVLLALRILIVVFIVLAFARPTVESSLPVFATYSQTSTVILMDNSFSMDLSDERGNRFKQAKFLASKIISGLEEGDELSIIPICGSKSEAEYSLTGNLNAEMELLKDLEVSVAKPNLDKVLSIAAELLGSSKNMNKDIFILSDSQKNLFSGMQEPAPTSNIGIMVFQIGKGSESELTNLSIDSLRIETKIFQAMSEIEISADIVNHSDRKVDALLVNMDYNNEKVDQRTVDLGATESVKVEMSARQDESGNTAAFLEIESDGIDQDNREYFSFVIPSRPRIAIFGEKNQYIEKALGGMNNTNEITSYSSRKILSSDLNKFEIVVLGTGVYSTSDINKVKSYIEQGGSAIVFANTYLDKQLFDEVLVTFGFGKSEVVSSKTGMEFSSVDKLHPIFDGVFIGTNSKKIVESPKIYTAYPIKSGNSIIEIDGGSFLAESTIGKGKVLYCAVSADSDMSTLPFTGIFPALMFRSSSYLVSGSDYGTYVTAGDKVDIKLPKSNFTNGIYKIVDPLGNESYANAVELTESVLLSIDELTQLGVYVIYDSREEYLASVIVNTEPTESELVYNSEKDFEKYLKDIFGENTGIEFIGSDENIDDGLLRARTGSELWQIFILLAIASALAEMMVAKNSKIESE